MIANYKILKALFEEIENTLSGCYNYNGVYYGDPFLGGLWSSLFSLNREEYYYGSKVKIKDGDCEIEINKEDLDELIINKINNLQNLIYKSEEIFNGSMILLEK